MAGKPLAFLTGDAAIARRGGQDCLVLAARLPSYRSLPLSCVRAITIAIDGEPVPEDDILLVVDGHTHRVRALGERIDLWWYILDQAEVLVTADRALEPGDHAIEGSITTIVPFATGGRSTDTSRSRISVYVPAS